MRIPPCPSCVITSGGVRHRLSGGSASALSYGGEKYGRSGRSGDGRAGGGGREKEDDTKSAENVSRGVLPSRQSLLDLVSGKFMGRHTPTHHYYHQHQQQVYSVSQRYFSSSRDSLQGGYVNRGASELDLSRKPRRRDHLRGRFKLPYTVALTPSRDQSHLHTPASVNHLSNSSCNGTETRYTAQQQQQQRGSRGYPGQPGSRGFRTGAPNWSFIFDPAGRLCYYWSMVVSLAFLYNFWVIIYRFAFQEINGETRWVWFCLDYFSDFLYVLDIIFHIRTGYLEDGVLQTDATKLRNHYTNSTTFYIDILCLLPLDFLYLSIGFNSMLRSFRLVKIYRFWAFMDRTERHTNYPNLFRSTSLIHYLLVIFHWNGCLYHIIYKNNGFGSKNWVFSDSETADVVKQYLQSYYWCTLALTTIGDLPRYLLIYLCADVYVIWVAQENLERVYREVGKEMYIVNRGRLQVVADNGKTVLATLKAGSYFGEISILNMGTAGKECGNRRTASVRSVGYSDLFVLSKKDMWDVLKEYPAARVRLEAIAVKRLEKYKRAPLEKVAMGRCQSTPGLVESRGRVSLEDMWISPIDLKTHAYSTAASLFSPSPSPVTSRTVVGGVTTDANNVPRSTESPMSGASSGPSSEDQTARVQPSAATQISTGRQSTHSGMTCNSMTQLVSEGATPLFGTHEALLAEIQRLRERLKCLETENAAMSIKLNQQQWEVEHRLAEIEMQICGASSTSSVEDNNERNRESII
ncbi:hypothetical protein P5V15_013222 [Pogonomyrmex californicus]